MAVYRAGYAEPIARLPRPGGVTFHTGRARVPATRPGAHRRPGLFARSPR